MKNNNASSLRIEIPRAEYKGMWHDFRKDNAPFFPDAELDRIETVLLRGGVAEHQCHTNGIFHFVPAS